jgi:hypothetical protein
MISLMFCVLLKFFRKLVNIAGKTGRITHTHMTDLQAIRDRNFTNSQAFCYPAFEEKQAIEVVNISN